MAAVALALGRQPLVVSVWGVIDDVLAYYSLMYRTGVKTHSLGPTPTWQVGTLNKLQYKGMADMT